MRCGSCGDRSCLSRSGDRGSWDVCARRAYLGAVIVTERAGQGRRLLHLEFLSDGSFVGAGGAFLTWRITRGDPLSAPRDA
jgi:hypothetical protein